MAFGLMHADTPNLLIEAIFVLEAVADTRWHVEQFLAPMPVRVLVDVHGQDLTEIHDAGSLADDVEDGEIERFLERPGFNAQLLKQLLEGATELAQQKSRTLKDEAQTKANGMLAADHQRLIDLRKYNDHVRPEEIALAQEQLQRVREAIGQARLRLDSIRLVAAERGGGRG